MSHGSYIHTSSTRISRFHHHHPLLLVLKLPCALGKQVYLCVFIEPIEVGYDPQSYVTRESAGSVELTIRVFSHPGGAPRPFSLLVNTEDGTSSTSETMIVITYTTLSHTAIIENDYVPVSGQVIQFNAGDIIQMHTILINDDNNCEKNPNENFFSNITLNSGIPDILVTVPRATVTIDETAEPECGKLKMV